MKGASLFLGALLCTLTNGVAQTPLKTETMEIQTDMLPPPSAEENDPMHPFFAAPSTGNEVMEEVEVLKERIKKLEERVLRIEEAKAS